MAYVAKSERVWNEISRNIENLFKEREHHALLWASYVDEKKFTNMCYRTLCTEEQEAAIQLIPHGWVKKENEFTFKFQVARENQKTLNTRYTATFTPKRFIPGHWNAYNDDYVIDKKIITPEIAEIILNRQKQIEAIAADKKDMVAGAKALYDKAKSINQFVKIWEPALSLLNEDTVARLRKRVERNASAASQGISEDDLNKLNTHYVKAKVSQ